MTHLRPSAHTFRVHTSNAGPADQNRYDRQACEDEREENCAWNAQQHQRTKDEGGEGGEDGDDGEGRAAIHVIAAVRATKSLCPGRRALRITASVFLTEKRPTGGALFVRELANRSTHKDKKENDELQNAENNRADERWNEAHCERNDVFREVK